MNKCSRASRAHISKRERIMDKSPRVSRTHLSLQKKKKKKKRRRKKYIAQVLSSTPSFQKRDMTPQGAK